MKELNLFSSLKQLSEKQCKGDEKRSFKQVTNNFFYYLTIHPY